MRWAWVILVLGCGGADPAAEQVDASSPDAQPSCGFGITPEAGLVVTDVGAVRGVADARAWSYKGIPYAAPPVGELRWRAPEAAACWDGERDGSQFGAACPQLEIESGNIAGEEDCLTLNVWTPLDPGATPLPVLVFIHGGGNVQGTASQPIYDGTWLAQNGPAVIVTIQYRLGALGWLTHPLLAENVLDGISGNYALLDAVAALQWVQRNAAVFGGDPGNVTLFGQSAGARNVCSLMASPLAAGLFQRAIMESGGCGAVDQVAAEGVGERFVDGTSCAGETNLAACLRGLTPAQIIAALPALGSVLASSPFQAHVDGAVLPAQPNAALREGSHNHVPFMVGANDDETGQAIRMAMTEMQYQGLVTETFGAALAPAILGEYPSAEYGTPRLAYVALTSDSRFICTARRIAQAAEASQGEPVFRYHFTHTLPPMAGAALGAFHGLELAYLFHTLGAMSDLVPSPEELAFADELAGYWLRFAATGDPNGAGATAWPAYAGTSDLYLGLDAPPVAGDGVRTEQCDFWDSLIP